jgi:sugar lactone lactonase YvrE
MSPGLGDGLAGMTEVLVTGLAMGESPRWHDGRLWVCDWLAGEVLAVGTDGRTEVVQRVEGLPFSIDWLPDGSRRTAAPAAPGTRSSSTLWDGST